MTNPADELYEIFKYWRSIKLKGGQQGTVKVSRFLSHSDTQKVDEGWEMQRRATRCLEAIAQIIDMMEEAGDSVESEKKYFRDWSHAVFAFPEGWSSSSSGVGDSAFMSLGLFRNSARRFVPELPEDSVGKLRQLLENEPSLTPPPGVFPVELFDYFTRVKHHLKHCIDNYEATSSFDLVNAAEHYRAAVFMMANGNFVTNPADWGRHAAATFVATKLKNFGRKIYDEAENQLARSAIRALEAGGQKMLEAGQSVTESLS